MIEINNIKYKLIEEYKDGYDEASFKEKYTEYFEPYDYIIGDWSYGKLRLKGFYESANKKCKKLNDIAGLEAYIENECAYGCRWFQLKKNK